jgi:pimeloyl-ACP methyl ester carboxylesterase
MYQVQRQALSTFVNVRYCAYHVHQWGQPQDGQPPLFLMHGWMDVGASFQFVVDAMAQDRWVLAPDWRGYGLTTGPATDNYWFPDYLADLDCLIDNYSPDTPIDLVGHSMGGNVVMQYAGVRPERIRRLINLEGFGMAQTRAENAPKRLNQWLNELKAQRAGDLSLSTYDDAEGVVRRLMKNNPRLTLDKAQWLAQHWSAQGEDGRWHIRGDGAHKIVNAQLHRVEEVLAMYQRITAPTLVVEAQDCSLDKWWQGKYTLDEFHQRLTHIPHCERAFVADAGHMLHHDQPEVVAGLIEKHLEA